MTSLHPLANSVTHPSPKRHDASAWIVLSGLFAAPSSWAVQLLVSYLLTGDRCHDVAEQGQAAFTLANAAVAILGALAITGCGLGFWAAYRTWQRTREEAPGDHHEGLSGGRGRTRFLGLCGMTSGVIFLVASIVELLVPMFESACGYLL